MQHVIWIIGDNRQDMVLAQRKINSTGSMRAFCMLSSAAVHKAIAVQNSDKPDFGSFPSLIIMDYQMASKEDFSILSSIRQQEALAGVPLFFMTEERNQELDEICFSKGAMVVLHKPFSQSGILRIERVAWQHEVTRNYEKMLQKQAGDLQAAREIMRLNQKLKSRNELLYHVFGRYFSDKVLEVILEHAEGASIGGEKRELTVLISDLRGFTSLSEELEPEAVTRLLNYYFDQMTDVITQYRGTIIEFLGDGVLAVFGAPLSSGNHIADAVAAGIEMQNRMSDVNGFCKEQGYPLLEMGIGIHSGEAFIGNVGSEKMMRYNVVGKVVNECSRIESYSVGGQVLVSREALDKIGIPVEVHNHMKIMAKGIQNPVSVCEVTALGGDYGCVITNIKFDAVVPVTEKILFHLYRIREKVITEKKVMARLEQFSLKRAVVATVEQKVPGQPMAERLEIYSDVAISATREDGCPLFDGVYAKIVDVKENRLVLHFTHVNHDFRQFAEDIMPGTMEGQVMESVNP